MRCGLTFRLARTHPARARSSGSETLSRSRSLVGYTIDTHETEVFGSHRRFVEGTDRGQSTLFPECLEDWICEDNPVRVIDVFVEGLDLAEHGLSGVDPEATDRP